MWSSSIIFITIIAKYFTWSTTSSCTTDEYNIGYNGLGFFSCLNFFLIEIFLLIYTHTHTVSIGYKANDGNEYEWNTNASITFWYDISGSCRSFIVTNIIRIICPFLLSCTILSIITGYLFFDSCRILLKFFFLSSI